MSAVMLLPGTNGSLLLVQRTVTRTIVLQETIGKVMAHQMRYEFIYILKDAKETNEDGDEKIVVSTSAPAMAAAGGSDNAGDTACAGGQNNKAHQYLESREDAEDSSWSSSSSSSSSSSWEDYLEEPKPSAELPTQILKSPPPKRKRRGRKGKFTLRQIEEMENVFIETQHPDISARKALARSFNVPEVDVMMWFVNRRVKERYNEKPVTLKSVPPPFEKVLVIKDIKKSS
ncbi:hypothetical protein STEG23_011010 [Scotinomys teguina]